MRVKHSVLLTLLACAGLALSTINCSFGNTSQPVDPNETATSSNAPAATAGPGEVVIQGDIHLTYRPSTLNASPLIDTIAISLLDSNQATGVLLFMPLNIEPGTYSIGDLFNQADAEVTARFDTFDGTTVDSYESISGTLTLTETGASFSGSFTFEAVHAPDGSRPITATGNFEGVTVGQ
jgi:hypothetical protein